MKKSKKISAKNLGVLIFVSIIVLILFISIIISEFSSGPIDRNNIQNVSISNATKNITEEDRKFQEWTNLLSDRMQGDYYCLAKAAEKKNLTDLEICGRTLKNNSDRSLREISEFNVSQSFEMTVSEYKKSLELYYLGGERLEMGAKNSDVELMANATMYIDQGKKKMTNAHYYLILVS